MRALIRETSKEYFKRYEKPTESIEKTMNTLEALNIANIVGIDVSEMKEMAWFFELVTIFRCRSRKSNYLKITLVFSAKIRQKSFISTSRHMKTAKIIQA